MNQAIKPKYVGLFSVSQVPSFINTYFMAFPTQGIYSIMLYFVHEHFFCGSLYRISQVNYIYKLKLIFQFL